MAEFFNLCKQTIKPIKACSCHVAPGRAETNSNLLNPKIQNEGYLQHCRMIITPISDMFRSFDLPIMPLCYSNEKPPDIISVLFRISDLSVLRILLFDEVRIYSDVAVIPLPFPLTHKQLYPILPSPIRGLFITEKQKYEREPASVRNERTFDRIFRCLE